VEAAVLTEPSQLLAALDGLLMADVGARDDAALADDLRVLQVLRNRLDGEFLRRLGVFDARGGAGCEHVLSTQAWLRSRCRLSAAAAAHGRVAVARRLRAGGPLADAVRAGDVSYEHAVVAARAVDALPVERRGPAEEILTAVAVSVDPGQLKRVAGTVREAVAPQTLVADQQEAFGRRFLNASPTLDGMVAVDGLLDPEGGAVFLAAVRGYGTPFGPADRRSAGQRRADAAVEVIRAGLDAAALPETGGEKPHVALTVDVGRFIDSGPVTRVQEDAVTWTRVPTDPTPVGWAGDGVALAGEVLRRVLCDASVHRVLTLGPSEVLDIGRRSRIWPPAIRRAAAVQYGGCGAQDCDRPPAFTDLHHVSHWLHDGDTSLANGIPLCRRHHILVHDGGWHVIRVGHLWTVVPPGDPRAQPPPDDRAA
jgi:hypothetical protein